MADLFKQVIPSIMQNKNSVFESDEEISKYLEKNSYIINKTLSMYEDCVIPANMMNINTHIDGKMKYDFLFNIIKRKKRKFNYVKKTSDDEDIDLIMEHFQVSRTKASEYAVLLSDDEIKRLKNTGGVDK